MDTDSATVSYAPYAGNGRRLVVMPINTYHPNYIIRGFGAFLLLPADQYDNGGNGEWCAEYIGPYIQECRHGCSYVTRLVQ